MNYSPLQLSEDLLRRDEWYNLALGVTINTGRRITEVLKTGIFSPKTEYTLWFKGQLKTKAYDLEVYEIPTLAPANLVIAAVERLRAIQDCSELENDEVSDQFGSVMRQIADRHLSPYIPKKDSEQNLYTHLSRSIYGRLCVLYHCPPQVFDIQYMAHILGHYWYFREKDREKRANLDSTMHYMDYVIGNGEGNLDGRRGIWLGKKAGVQVLDEFRKEWEGMAEPTKRRGRAKQQQSVQGEQHAVTPKKRSIINCTPAQKTLFDAEMDRRGFAHQQELVGVVLNESTWYRQMAELLAPLALEFQSATPLETLRKVLDTQREVQFQEHWNVSLEEVDTLFQQAQAEGHKEPLKHFKESRLKRENYKSGAAKRMEKYQQIDFTQLPYPQLERVRAPEAALERLRRVVWAIMEHNEQAEPRDRWYINPGLIYQMKTIRHELINAYLKEHQEAINAHHQRLGIEPRYNRKMVKVNEMVTIPENPPPVGWNPR